MKLADFVTECEQHYGLRIAYGSTIKISHVKKLRRKLYALKQSENVVLAHGTGKRKTPLQKSIETLHIKTTVSKGITVRHPKDKNTSDNQNLPEIQTGKSGTDTLG